MIKKPNFLLSTNTIQRIENGFSFILAMNCGVKYFGAHLLMASRRNEHVLCCLTILLLSGETDLCVIANFNLDF